MKYTRVYTDENGDSNFDDVEIELQDQGTIGWLSRNYPVKEIQFRRNNANYDWDYHNAPARQFIVLLDGEIAITTSKGITRYFEGGDILLMEDIDGKGHKTRNVKDQLRHSIFIKL